MFKHLRSRSVILGGMALLVTAVWYSANASSQNLKAEAQDQLARAQVAQGAAVNEANQQREDIGVTAERLQELVDEAHKKYRNEKSGKNASYIPELAKIPSDLFGICIMTVNGEVVTAGDVDYSFAIESVSKPFTLCIVMREQGYEAVLDKIGVEPTGLPFNSVTAVELHKGAVNPLVNAGAMASVSMLEAKTPEERFNKILTNFSEFAGEDLKVIEKIYESEASTNWHNKGIAWLLDSYHRLYCNPDEACDVYTRQCSIGVTAKQLATMGATLANRGVNPKTGKRLLDKKLVPKVLPIMMTCGFYDGSGQWACEAGLPSKTGVGGGIVSVVPGRMAIVAFSPPLDEHGNSVRAQLAIKWIAEQLELSLFDGRN